MPCSRASSYIDSIASPARCTRLVGSVVSVTEPASYRLISSRSASSRSNRSVCVCSSSTVRDVGPGKSSRWPYSTSPASRIVVSGVRSSCDTSETNRCCMTDSSASSRMRACRLSAMPLKDAASVASSSSPLSGIRTPRSPAARRRLVAAVARIGSMTPRTTTSVMALSRASSAAAPTTPVTCMNASVCSASARS